MGEPDTLKILEGALSATLVTVPIPAGKSAVVKALKVGSAALPVVGPANTKFADCVFRVAVKVPELVTAELGVELKTVPSPVNVTEVTVPVPTGKSAVTSDLKVGLAALPVVGPARTVLAVCVPKSAPTSDLKVGVAAAPLVGPAHRVLALCVTKESAKVPADVTGEPDTLKILEGAVKATLVTVPLPPPPPWGGHSNEAISLNPSHKCKH